MLDHHRQTDAGLSEQRRPAISWRAEPARLRLDAAAAIHVPAIGACPQNMVNELRGGLDGIRQRLELRLSLGVTSRNDPEHVH